MQDAIQRSRQMGLTSIAADLDFRGQTVLVTGGAAGIGLDKARALHRLGAHVIALDIQRQALEALETELGDRITILPFDLSQTDDAAYEDLAKQIVSSSPTGQVDGYIINAGVVKLTDINRFNTVANTPSFELIKMAQINAHSHVMIYQKLRDHFASNARILVTSSPIVGRADPKTVAYSVTKRMLDSYANNIAAELQGTGLIIAGYVPPPVQNFLRTDLKPNEPLHAHPHGIDMAELPLRLLSATVSPEFNGKVVAMAYDHLRDKSQTLEDGTSFDCMPRDAEDNGFVYDFRVRQFDQGGGDAGDALVSRYSTGVFRNILGMERTPDMDTNILLKHVYRAPEHVAKMRNDGPA